MDYSQSDLENFCRDIYTETRDHLYNDGDRIPFEILMGPPRMNPPYFFIGYQPGLAKTDMHPDECRRQGYEHNCVTSTCQYATEKWILAKKIRQLFYGRTGLLEQSVGTNAIFVKAKSVEAYGKEYTKQQRQAHLNFSLAKVKAMIDLMKPKKIILIGLAAIELFATNEKAVPLVYSTKQKNRCLVKQCRIFDHEALAVIHLSGARISLQDMDAIKQTVFTDA